MYDAYLTWEFEDFRSDLHKEKLTIKGSSVLRKENGAARRGWITNAHGEWNVVLLIFYC